MPRSISKGVRENASQPPSARITRNGPQPIELPMTKDFLRVSCPCCKKTLEVDVARGKARAVTGEGKTLDDMLQDHTQESARLDDAFDAARAKEADKKDQLDDLFRQAKEDSKGDTSKPRNPFELE